jgi:hypothetical protein
MMVYINIITAILDIIHLPVFYLKGNISETEFRLRLQVALNALSPIDRPGPETGTTSVGWTQLSTFHLKTVIESRLRNVMF